MTASPQRWRLALFCLCALAPLLAALSFSSGAPDPRPSAAEPVAGGPAEQLAPNAAAPDLRHAARRFFLAFFAYEAGEVERRSVRRSLRATATPAFAAELLSSPPRLSGSRLPPARLERLAISAIPASPARALVSGEARRAERTEQLSVLFDLRHGTWLARGLGE